MWWTRLKALIVKELLAVLRDPKGRTVLIGPPIIQLLVFSYAATLEVTNVDLMVLNRDNGHWSRELVQQIGGSPTFRSIELASSPHEVRLAIDTQRVLAVVRSAPPSPATRGGETGGGTDDPRRPAFQRFADRLRLSRPHRRRRAAETPAGKRASSETIRVEARNWFNPNLTYQWFMVPNLVASIALLIGLIVTALSVARERELGTFDQLIVSPLRTHEILLGKLIPPMMIGLFHITIYILAAVFIFGVPLRGSLFLLYGSAIFYLAAVVGLGLFISALSMTQQQAILGAFLFMVPAMLLSGFATPIENMPSWLQPVTLINPLRYFLVIVKGVFLKDIPVTEVVHQTLPLCLIAIVTLSSAAWLFRRRLE